MWRRWRSLNAYNSPHVLLTAVKAKSCSNTCTQLDVKKLTTTSGMRLCREIHHHTLVVSHKEICQLSLCVNIYVNGSGTFSR